MVTQTRPGRAVGRASQAGGRTGRARPAGKSALPPRPALDRFGLALPQPARGPDAAALRRLLGLSQEELGRALGYSTRSVAAWEGGRQAVGPSARLKLTEARRLGEALAQLMPAGAVGGWLRAANPAFEGQAPIQLIERGESDRLWRMVHQIDANVAS